jgi:hypothetical protein
MRYASTSDANIFADEDALLRRVLPCYASNVIVTGKQSTTAGDARSLGAPGLELEDVAGRPMAANIGIREGTI